MDRTLGRDLLVLAALIISAAAFYLVSQPLVAILGLVIFSILCLFRVDLGLLGVVIFLPYFMRPKHFAGHQFAVSQALLAAAVVAALLISLVARVGLLHQGTGGAGRSIGSKLIQSRPCWSRLISSPFLIPAGVFLLAAAISTALAVERHLALREFGQVIAEPMLFFVLVLLFYPLEAPKSRSRPAILMGLCIVLTGVFPSLIAIGQYVTHQGLVQVLGASYQRAPAWYRSPDNFGLLLDRTLPMAVALLLMPILGLRARLGLRLRESDVRKQLFHRLAPRGPVVAGTMVMGIALLLTFVLGAWIATAVTVLVLLAIRFTAGRWLAVTLLLVVILGLGLASTGGFIRSHSITAGRRVDIWKSSIQMIRSHPIFGVGPDNFLHYYAPKHQRNIQCPHGLGYMQPGAWPEPCISHPHDEVLDLWLTTGTAGLLSFAWLQVVFWRCIWKRRSRLAQEALLLGAAGAMLAGLLHGLVDNSYFLIDLSMLTWLLFAIASLCLFEHPANPLGDRRKPERGAA